MSEETKELVTCEECGSTRMDAKTLECDECGCVVSICHDCGVVLEGCDCGKYAEGFVPKGDGDNSDDDLYDETDEEGEEDGTEGEESDEDEPEGEGET